jgi:MFS family permease
MKLNYFQITFSFLIACAAGAIIVSHSADILGRKRSIQFGSLIFVIGATLQTAAIHTYMLYAGRVVAGLAVGIMSTVVPLYISETAHTMVRGRLISIYQVFYLILPCLFTHTFVKLMITIGIFIASCVNSVILAYLTCCKELQWRLAFGMQIIPALFLVSFIIPTIPFSPRWLLLKGLYLCLNFIFFFILAQVE